MIKVGLDISQTAHIGGVSTYTKNLSNQLSTIPEVEMSYFYSSLRKYYSGGLKNVKTYRFPPTLLEIMFNRLRNISIEKFLGNIDVFHSSDWMQPPTKAKKVTTYHDVVPLLYPEWSHPKIVAVHKKRLEIVEKEIDMVIAVSKTTKEDLLKVSKIPKEKIVVIYEGVDNRFKPQPADKIEEFKKKYKLPEIFVLAIGGIGERRNLGRVRAATTGYDLVITGETIPWLPEEEMPLLYSAARVLLYPSLYEGFGLPILEAMACETPVVTSNISAMSEIAGDAAYFVDPYDVEDIVLNLKEAMKDDQQREDLIGNGILQASNFTWENCAYETVDIYRELMKKK